MRGVLYFSLAGNQAKNSWEGAFVSSGRGVPIFDVCDAHDFGGGNVFQNINLSRGTRIALQWDDPFFSVSGEPGAATEIDCFYTS